MSEKYFFRSQQVSHLQSDRYYLMRSLTVHLGETKTQITLTLKNHGFVDIKWMGSKLVVVYDTEDMPEFPFQFTPEFSSALKGFYEQFRREATNAIPFHTKKDHDDTICPLKLAMVKSFNKAVGDYHIPIGELGAGIFQKPIDVIDRMARFIKSEPVTCSKWELADRCFGKRASWLKFMREPLKVIPGPKPPYDSYDVQIKHKKKSGEFKTKKCVSFYVTQYIRVKDPVFYKTANIKSLVASETPNVDVKVVYLEPEGVKFVTNSRLRFQDNVLVDPDAGARYEGVKVEMVKSKLAVYYKLNKKKK